MAECNWDPSKHGNRPCPVHGAGGTGNQGGHKIRINNGKYQVKLSDDSDWEDVSPEEYNDLREGGYQEFDETVDDDFGFDENELDDLSGFEDNFTENDIKQIETYAEKYEIDVDELKQRIWDKFNEKIQDGASVTNAKNDAMEEALEDVVAGEFDESKNLGPQAAAAGGGMPPDDDYEAIMKEYSDARKSNDLQRLAKARAKLLDYLKTHDVEPQENSPVKTFAMKTPDNSITMKVPSYRKKHIKRNGSELSDDGGKTWYQVSGEEYSESKHSESHDVDMNELSDILQDVKIERKVNKSKGESDESEYVITIDGKEYNTTIPLYSRKEAVKEIKKMIDDTHDIDVDLDALLEYFEGK